MFLNHVSSQSHDSGKLFILLSDYSKVSFDALEIPDSSIVCFPYAVILLEEVIF